MIVWLVIFICVLWIVNFRMKRKRMHELASLLPKPEEELYFIGMAHKFTGNMEGIMLALKKIIYDSMQHNGIIRIWLGHLLYVVLTNPVDVEMVVKTCLEKDDVHKVMRTAVGNGVIFAPLHIWRRRRKILVRAFTTKHLDGTVEILSNQSEKLTEVLESKANKEPFTMWHYLSSYTFDSVCDSTIGIKTNTLNDENGMVLKSTTRLFELVTKRIFYLWLQPDWLYKLFPQYLEHEKCLEIATSFVDEAINKKRNVVKNRCKVSQHSNENLENCTSYLLEFMIFSSSGDKGFSDMELREEIMGLLAAGMDTSAIAIGNVLKLLAGYPEVQENLYKELNQVFGDSNRLLVKEDLSKLKYMECVVKETLRLFPPVPVIARKILQDMKLPSGRILPAGTGAVCSIFGVHRDPRYWGPNAEEFDPDRFLPENFNLAHTCSYMPFSNGPRNCIGYQYAMMTTKTALAAILRRFRIIEDKTSSVPFLKFKYDITMKAVDDYQIALEKRKAH